MHSDWKLLICDSTMTILPLTVFTVQTPPKSGLALLTGLGANVAETDSATLHTCHLHITPTLLLLAIMELSDRVGTILTAATHLATVEDTTHLHLHLLHLLVVSIILLAAMIAFHTTAQIDGDTPAALVPAIRSTMAHTDTPAIPHQSQLGTGTAHTAPTLHGSGDHCRENVSIM